MKLCCSRILFAFCPILFFSGTSFFSLLSLTVIFRRQIRYEDIFIFVCLLFVKLVDKKCIESKSALALTKKISDIIIKEINY